MRSLSTFSLNSRGFSLLEILIVLGIVALIAGGSIVVSFNSVSRSTIFGERDFLVSMLHAQRGAALANINETAHGLHIGSTNYVLFEGTTYNAGAATNRSVPHGTLTFTGPTDIVFEQLTGSILSGQGTVNMSGNGQTQSIDINSYGRIDW